MDRLSAESGTTFFPGIERRDEALFWPYFVGGQRTYWKARALSEKTFVSQKDAKASFFNLDNVLSGPLDAVYITEGEFDAASLIEAGISLNRVLSVPGGAPEKLREEDEESTDGFGYVLDALAMGLNKVRKFVWCGDSDGPGRILRRIMAKILGQARFHFLEWPDGVKDANDFLLSDGADALREMVEQGSLPWPVDGLYLMSEIPEPPPIFTWSPGFEEWENKIKLAPGMLSVVTGLPNHGKTVLWAQIWFQIVRKYGFRIAMASFETGEKPHLRRQIRTLHSLVPEMNMDGRMMAAADRFIDDHYVFLKHPEGQPDLNWLLDRAEVAVVRYGVKAIQVDPWNRMEHKRENRESETDYIGRCLNAVIQFARDMHCHVQILAHPSKRDGHLRKEPPELEDISGSMNWFNRVDQGFVVHRPDFFKDGKRCTEADLYQRKARFEELGYVCKVGLNYDLEKRRYVSTDYETR
ncbi:AAA family ATPase [Labrys sp. KB_33_2]|uniref:DnaB-like helicase C-terminal domain-containing protein n=1 Tax=Labrys sp. KB_33_2 TaxID=3237479 RepID=UPI003F938D94